MHCSTYLSTTESLLDKLKSHDFTALTEGGAQWVRKALHPAEATVKAPRIPSRGTRPTAVQEITSTFVINPPAAAHQANDLWNAVIEMKNDPLCPLQVRSYWADDAAHADSFTCINQGFAGTSEVFAAHTRTDYHTVLTNFMDACEMYRTTAISVTGVFVGATLTDQGSIISAQMSDPHLEVNVTEPDADTGTVTLPGYFIAQEAPNSDALILGTTPYVVSAREGFYVPLKLREPEKWHRSDNVQVCARILNGWRNSSGVLDLHYATFTHLGATPYPAGNSGPGYQNWLPPLDDGLSVTWVRNVAASSSFRVTVRIAIECMTRPSSKLAPFTDLPALPDDHALAMYYEIASRMKDAYPAKDNDTGSLWNKIKNIAGGIWDAVSPALSAVPGAGAVVSGVNLLRKVAPKAIQVFAERGAKKRITDDDGVLLPSAQADAAAAAKLLNSAAAGNEKAQAAIKAVAPSAPRRRRKGKGKKKKGIQVQGNATGSGTVRMWNGKRWV